MVSNDNPTPPVAPQATNEPAPGSAPPPFTVKTCGFTMVPDDLLARHDVSFGAKLCLARLMRYASGPDGKAWPAVPTLANDIGTGARNCRKLLAELMAAGLVARVERPGHSNIFRLPLNNRSTLDPGTIVQPTPEQSFNPPLNNCSTHPGTIVPTMIPLKKEGKKELKQTTSAAPDVVFPLSLSSSEFKEAWQKWETHLQQKRKPLTPLTADEQLKFLAELGEIKAIESISNSIRSGWPTLYEPRPAAPAKFVHNPDKDYFGLADRPAKDPMSGGLPLNQQPSHLQDMGWGTHEPTPAPPPPPSDTEEARKRF